LREQKWKGKLGKGDNIEEGAIKRVQQQIYDWTRKTHTHTHTHTFTHSGKEKELGKSGELGFGVRLPGKLFEALAPPPCPSRKRTREGEDEKSMLRWFKV